MDSLLSKADSLVGFLTFRLLKEWHGVALCFGMWLVKLLVGSLSGSNCAGAGTAHELRNLCAFVGTVIEELLKKAELLILLIFFPVLTCS